MQPILLLDIISRGDGIVVLANGAGFVGIGTTLPSTKLEVQGTASASYFMASGSVQFGSNVATASYSRFGGTSVTRSWLNSADDLLISDDLYVVGSISANIASASQYKGLAFTSVGDCNDETDVLGWDNGVFSCTADDTGAGSSFSGLEIFNSGGTPGLRYGSISFDASDFTVTLTDTSSTAFIKLDYANGPASRSIEQTILSQWEFRNGASFSADLEIYDNSGPAFAIFSSTSLGRFGLGDVTPETFFEI